MDRPRRRIALAERPAPEVPRLRTLGIALALTMAALGGGVGHAADGPGVPVVKAVDSIEARVQGCTTCHGQVGQGTANGYFPRIAGKPAGYLLNQLIAFRDGTRRYAPMNYLVAYLPDPYLREIADYFARQRPPFAPVDPADPGVPAAALLERGRQLAVVGDPTTQVPPCIACHGATLTGMEPGIPGLAGLRSTYIAAQLTRWRVGERHAREPDCMKRIAGRLGEADVAAVAAWLASRPAPTDLMPEASNRVRMPLTCGSQLDGAGGPR